MFQIIRKKGYVPGRYHKLFFKVVVNNIISIFNLSLLIMLIIYFTIDRSVRLYYFRKKIMYYEKEIEKIKQSNMEIYELYSKNNIYK